MKWRNRLHTRRALLIHLDQERRGHVTRGKCLYVWSRLTVVCGGKDMPCGAVESGSVRHMTSNDKGSRGIVLTAPSECEWLSNPSPGAHRTIRVSASLRVCVCACECTYIGKEYRYNFAPLPPPLHPSHFSSRCCTCTAASFDIFAVRVSSSSSLRLRNNNYAAAAEHVNLRAVAALGNGNRCRSCAVCDWCCRRAAAAACRRAGNDQWSPRKCDDGYRRTTAYWQVSSHYGYVGAFVSYFYFSSSLLSTELRLTDSFFQTSIQIHSTKPTRVPRRARRAIASMGLPACMARRRRAATRPLRSSTRRSSG